LLPEKPFHSPPCSLPLSTLVTPEEEGNTKKKEKEKGEMGKKKEKGVNVSGKPRHSLDVNRSNGKGKGDKSMRSAATVRRLKMVNQRPKRDSGGKLLWQDLQSKELPNTRIEPDRRWFGSYAPPPPFSYLSECYLPVCSAKL
jgi:NGP1NT (NUC091) domain